MGFYQCWFLTFSWMWILLFSLAHCRRFFCYFLVPFRMWCDFLGVWENIWIHKKIHIDIIPHSLKCGKNTDFYWLSLDRFVLLSPSCILQLWLGVISCCKIDETIGTEGWTHSMFQVTDVSSQLPRPHLGIRSLLTDISRFSDSTIQYCKPASAFTKSHSDTLTHSSKAKNNFKIIIFFKGLGPGNPSSLFPTEKLLIISYSYVGNQNITLITIFHAYGDVAYFGLFPTSLAPRRSRSALRVFGACSGTSSSWELNLVLSWSWLTWNDIEYRWVLLMQCSTAI